MRYQDFLLMEGAERPVALALLFCAIHDINRSEGDLHVAFPKWVDPVVEKGSVVTPGDPGGVLRVFGSLVHLLRLANNGYVDEVLTRGLATRIPPAAVRRRKAWVRFRRLWPEEKGDYPAHLRVVAVSSTRKTKTVLGIAREFVGGPGVGKFDPYGLSDGAVAVPHF